MCLNLVWATNEMPELLLALGGFILFIYVIFSRRFLSKKKYGKSLYQERNISMQKDVLGMDKAVLEDADNEIPEIDNKVVLKRKTILLIILIIIGIYLIISNSNAIKTNYSTSESSEVIQGD